MIKKTFSYIAIINIYIVLMVFASFYVPIKAVISYGGEDDPDAYTQLGYYPIWEIKKKSHEEQEQVSSNPVSGPEIDIRINVTAWVIQYIAITLIFLSMLYRNWRRFRL
jgi:hypothetical protein